MPRDLTLEWPLSRWWFPFLRPFFLPLSGYLRIVTLTAGRSALRREIIELSEEWEKMSEAAGRWEGHKQTTTSQSFMMCA